MLNLSLRLILFIVAFSASLSVFSVETLDSLKEKISYYEHNNNQEKKFQTQIELTRELIFYKGEVEEGLTYARNTLDDLEDSDFPAIKARLQYVIGFTLIEYENDLENGISYYFKALEFYENNQENFDSYLDLLLNISNAYYTFESFDEAIKFNKKGLEQAEFHSDPSMVADFQSNLGACYDGKKDTDNAAYYWGLAKEYYKKAEDYSSYYAVEVNLALIRLNKPLTDEDIKELEEVYSKAIPLFEQEENYYSLLAAKEGYGKLLSQMGQFEMADKYLKEALEIAEAFESLEFLSSVYYELAGNYLLSKQYQGEAEMLRKFIAAHDSLIAIEKTKAIADTRTKYEAEKKERENKLLKQKEEIQETKLENERFAKYSLFAGLGIILVFSAILMNRFLFTQKQKRIIEEKKSEVDAAYDSLEIKNNEILDSINYAKRIQAAILPPDSFVKQHIPESFVMYEPKDIVAGDFYWMEMSKSASAPIAIGTQQPTEQEGTLFFAAADCTGHGVPGAMVSVVCNNGLNRAVREYGITDPGKILDKTRELVVREFEKSEEEVKDGMDISLVKMQKTKDQSDTYEIEWAGANNPIWIIRKETNLLEEIKADKQPIGKFRDAKPFTTHRISLKKGDTFYIFTDGFSDQFGMDQKKPGGKKLKSSNFKKLLMGVQSMSMEEQKSHLLEFFHNWKGDLEQLDDVCIIGVRV